MIELAPADFAAALAAHRKKAAARGNPPIPDPARLNAIQRAAIAKRCDTILPFTQLFWPLVEPERPFVDGWHLHCIGEHLQDVSNPTGSIRNLIINVPPRCSKSLLVCVFWFAWAWTKYPWTRWMFSSFASDLVKRDSNRCRDLIRHPLYQSLWDVRVKGDSDTQLRFSNTHEGFRYATTVGGQGMGEGADFIVVDDPINPKKARSAIERANCVYWWRTTMARRVTDERTARRVIIMQRLHEGDLTGYITAEQTGWDHLVIPMRYEPRRYVFLGDCAGPGESKSGAARNAEQPEPPAPVAEPATIPEAAADPAGFAAALAALRAAGAGRGGDTPARDAIRLTAVQRARPELVDGPDGSGRTEQGELLWPERFPPAEVIQAESDYGPDAAGQYQQRPSAESGEIFARESFRRWEPFWEEVTDEKTGESSFVFGGVNLFGPDPDPDAPPRRFPAGSLTFFQCIDTAITEKKRSAYTAVGTMFATPEFDLGIWHMWRGKMAVQYQYGLLTAIRRGPVLWSQKSHVLTPAGAWPFTVQIQAVEAKASGIGLIQEGASKGTPYHPLKVDGDKVQKAVPVASMYAAGKVYHPPPARAWVVELEDELCLFPNGTFKDQADVVAYGGYMVTHDKLIRGLCGTRTMAEAGDPAADAAREAAERAKDGGVVTINTMMGPIEVDFGDDGGFGDRWRNR